MTDAKTDTKIEKSKPRALTTADYERDPKLRAQRVQTLATYFADPARREKFARLAQGTISVEQMIEVVLAAVSKTPKLAACTLESIALAVQEAAELGILPSAVNGMAHLVPYQNRKKAAAAGLFELYEAKLIPDYKGLVHLARESGSVLSVSAGVIYKDQVQGKDWSAEEGTNDHLWVKPLPPGHRQRDEDVAYAWAAAKIPAPTAPGGVIVQWVLLTRAEVDKVRAGSRAANDGPWVNQFPEMAKKTAVRRLSKLAPRRGKFAKAIALEDRAEADPEDLEEGELVDAKAAAKPRRATRAEEVLAAIASVNEAAGELFEAPAEAAEVREPTDAELEAERAARK